MAQKSGSLFLAHFFAVSTPAVLLAAAWLVGACSSDVRSESANGGVGGQSPLVAGCPPSAPTLGQPCDSVGVMCEYGADLDPNWECNVATHCSVQSVWEDKSYSNTTCPTALDPCVDVTPQAGCTEQGAQCSVAAGVCTCASVIVAPGQQMALLWMCAEPEPACPPWPDRPRLGTPCSTPDLVCDYAPCGAYGLHFRCQADGSWSDSFGVGGC